MCVPVVCVCHCVRACYVRTRFEEVNACNSEKPYSKIPNPRRCPISDTKYGDWLNLTETFKRLCVS